MALSQCTRVASTPVRLVLALLSLIGICLCSMVGIALLANIVYSTLVPAVTGQLKGTSTVVPHVVAAVAAAVLVTEVVVYHIAALTTIITQISFVSWFRTGWHRLLLAGTVSASHGETARQFWRGIRATAVLASAADLSEQLFFVMLLVCCSLSALLAVFWRPSEGGDGPPDPELAATAPLGSPSTSPLLGAETFAKDTVRIAIMLHSLVVFAGTVALLASRALYGMCRGVVGWYRNPKLAHTSPCWRAARIALLVLGSPFLLIAIPVAMLALRALARALPKSPCPRLYRRLCTWYFRLPLFEFRDSPAAGAWLGTGGQAIALALFGVGESAWHNFLHGVRRYTAWYTFLWFCGSLLYVSTAPGVVLTLGLVGCIGCGVWLRRWWREQGSVFCSCRRNTDRRDSPRIGQAPGPAPAITAAAAPVIAAVQQQVQAALEVADRVVTETLVAAATASHSDHVGTPSRPARSPPSQGVVVDEEAATAEVAFSPASKKHAGQDATSNTGVGREQVKLDTAALGMSSHVRAWLDPGTPIANLQPHQALAQLSGEDVAAALNHQLRSTVAEQTVSMHAIGKRGSGSAWSVNGSIAARREALLHAARLVTIRRHAAATQAEDKEQQGKDSVPGMPELQDGASAIAASLPTPTLASLDERTAVAVSEAEVDVECAWGSVLLAGTIFACLAGFAVKPALGAAMTLLTLFLVGSWCMRRPRHSCGTTLCRLLMVLVAAVYGVFTSSYANQDKRVSQLLLAPTWDNSSSTADLPVHRQYDICGAVINGLSPLDHCFLSLSAYANDSLRHHDLSGWFWQVNATVSQLPLNSSDSGVYMSAYRMTGGADGQDRLLVAIRGTTTSRDIAQDGLLWQEVMVFQLMSYIAPLSTWPDSVKRRFIGLVSAVEGPFGVQDGLRYSEAAVEAVRDLLDRYPDLPVSVSGHSLGGGLATLVGQRLGVSSVSFSGPGVSLSGQKLGLPSPLSYDLTTTIVPDSDIVPRIDEQVGTVQEIRCLRQASALKCHSIARTCCELRRNCGDNYGRTMTQCPGFA